MMEGNVHVGMLATVLGMVTCDAWENVDRLGDKGEK